MADTPAHDQHFTHSYTISFPEHEPRESDPHYHLFEAYKRAHKATAKCYVGERIGFDHCAGGLELHHHYLEFATINGADVSALQKDFPDLNDAEAVARWAEGDANLLFLCSKHHRSAQAGAHSLSHSDWSASLYDPGLTGDKP